ncbi:MAG TPA: fibronectin type III domain-containing protein [Thermoanaerobaculia bacterium]|nr:fibronectin type III domain-containing protein [Thermoanaerobaculia bacterium]
MRARRSAWLSLALAAVSTLFAFAGPSEAQQISAARGVDPRVDYASLMEIGPWDDRNYALTKEDLALLAPNEREQRDPVPAFFRVEMRKANPKLRREGPAQYPRSALQIFQLNYGGYLIDGQIYQKANYRDGRYFVIRENGISEEEWSLRALSGEVRVTSPTGGAESAIKINHTNIARVIAGSNGPGTGQKMHYSSNGGATWTQATDLPLGSTCCDPTVDWSYDGTKAYTATLGSCTGSGCGVWFYRSGDNGATWSDLGADPRRELTSTGSDKEYIHVDKYVSSPFRDNIYITWHDNNTMKFARSSDLGQTWSATLTLSSGSTELGIGSDITTDKSGNVYYFWPAFNSNRILVRKSTNGGTSFNPVVQVAATNDGFDFAIPSMETRRAFIYVAADADTTAGPFANRIYAAWTDTTAAESGTPANNHARIQVGYSTDGGATWNLRTPHSTADQSTVDRFHPWLAVDTDGTVYVAYYDTRHSSGRTGTDFYYSKSTDGGNTWSAPARLTTVTSPNISDSFEWGDYNGLDVLSTQFLSIFTDNRNESGGTGNSVDVYSAAPSTGPCTPPAAPTGLSATAVSSSQINLSWSAVSGATEYRILRSTTSGGPYTQVGTSTTTSFSNTGLTASTTYYYVVRSFATCESGNSAQASATTLPGGGCTTQTLYTHNFETGTGLSNWIRGTFVSGGSVTSWRGIQTCTAQGGTKIFRFGGSTCTADYSSNNFNYAQPNGAGGVAVPAGATSTTLTFGHRRAFESGFDGGTLAVSLNGTNYTYVPASAITGTTYNGTVSASCPPTGSAGVSIFTGSATSFSNTTVNLDAVCNLITGGSGGCAGQSVRVAFTTITDCSVTGDGWFLDNVTVTSCVP